MGISGLDPHWGLAQLRQLRIKQRFAAGASVQSAAAGDYQARDEEDLAWLIPTKAGGDGKATMTATGPTALSRMS
jgi:hypothetical protein